IVFFLEWPQSQDCTKDGPHFDTDERCRMHTARHRLTRRSDNVQVHRVLIEPLRAELVPEWRAQRIRQTRGAVPPIWPDQASPSVPGPTSSAARLYAPACRKGDSRVFQFLSISGPPPAAFRYARELLSW